MSNTGGLDLNVVHPVSLCVHLTVTYVIIGTGSMPIRPIITIIQNGFPCHHSLIHMLCFPLFLFFDFFRDGRYRDSGVMSFRKKSGIHTPKNLFHPP